MYGYCPYCGKEAIRRERSPNGNTFCVNGHSFPHAETLAEKPVETQLITIPAILTLPPEEELISLLGGEALDDVIRDLKANEAMEINNNGVEAQLEYLRAYLCPEAFANLIHENID